MRNVLKLKPWRRGALVFIALYTALCAALVFGSHFFTPTCAEWTGTRQIGVVLGAGTTRKKLSHTTLERVYTGVALYHSGQVARLHMSGHSELLREPMGRRMAETAAAQGVPATALSWESASLSTLENALFSVPLLPPEADLVVITDAFHSLRGGASFVWAGRTAALCATRPSAVPPGQVRYNLLRETVAWGINIPRAGVHRLASLAGLASALPDWFLE